MLSQEGIERTTQKQKQQSDKGVTFRRGGGGISVEMVRSLLTRTKLGANARY